MSTTTTRLGLTKPAGSEDVDISILNANFDIIDANIGGTKCTSGTRPATPYTGMVIYETDTKRFLMNTGIPGAAIWTDLIKAFLQNPLPLAAATSLGYQSQVTGDAAARFETQADGKLWWGAGAGAVDTNLYRSAANVLSTDDTFEPAAISLGVSAWMPTWNNVTVGAGGFNSGFKLDLGGVLFYQFMVKFGTSPSFASTISFDLPVTGYSWGGKVQQCFGTWNMRDESETAHYGGSIGGWDSGGVSASLTYDGTRVTAGTPVTIAVNDTLSGQGFYMPA